MLVSCPYREVDLTVEQIELLRDIGFVAAHMLAWSAAVAASSSQADAERIDSIAAKPVESALDLDSLMANRQELETSLERGHPASNPACIAGRAT